EPSECAGSNRSTRLTSTTTPSVTARTGAPHAAKMSVAGYSAWVRSYSAFPMTGKTYCPDGGPAPAATAVAESCGVGVTDGAGGSVTAGAGAADVGAAACGTARGGSAPHPTAAIAISSRPGRTRPLVTRPSCQAR